MQSAGPLTLGKKRTLTAQTKTPRDMLKHICPLLQVRDLAASVAFYGQMLALKTGCRENGFSIVRRDECTIFLAQKTKEANVTNKAARAVDDGWCNFDMHIHCEPGTLDALHAEIKAKGVPMPVCFADGPVVRPYGVRDFSVFDPDGYDLVFAEECESLDADRSRAS
jgi:hypothetical protein